MKEDQEDDTPELDEYELSFRIKKDRKFRSKKHAESALKKLLGDFRGSAQYKYFEIVEDSEEVEKK